LIARADRALYEAKRAGRDRTVAMPAAAVPVDSA
jgi:PleD family two-component response regulator